MSEKTVAFADCRESFEAFCKLRNELPEDYDYIEKPEQLDELAPGRRVIGIGDWSPDWRAMFNGARERGINVTVYEVDPCLKTQQS